MSLATRISFCIATGAIFAALTATSATAQANDRMLSYTFNYFSDVSGVSVYSHHGTAGSQLAPRVALGLQWTHDVVVIPAIDAPAGSQEAADAITTASRPIADSADPYEDFVKVRDELTGTASYGRAQASYYMSRESDYYAQMVSANYNHDLLHDNLNVSVGAAYGWDDITPLADLDTPGLEDFQKTLHANVIATQVLTRTTVLRAGLELNRVEGLQHDPYRNVYVAGGNVPESHPDYRDRRNAFFRVSQYITNRSSLMLDYRYYTDDWGVDSHTIGGKLNQYVTNQVIVRYRYRYYAQDAAYFFDDDYVTPGGIDGYQTGDYRLGDYTAHLFGGSVLWFAGQAFSKVSFLRRTQITFSYERYFNTNNFSADVFETGLNVAF